MISLRRRFVLSSLVLGVAAISPAVALGANSTNLPLKGKSTAVVATDISTTPATVTVSSSGHFSHLGAFIAIGNESLTPLGAPPVIPYRLTGSETLIMANGDNVFGAVNGTGVNNSGATSGTNLVTITGGTGRFANAAGSYTETYTGQIFSQIGTTMLGPVHTTIRGHIRLGGGYVDPLAGHQTHHQRHQRRGSSSA
ncbi:MAG TPA: hypothetical protein VGF93_06845 [Solirubrobacteraceae bacterium]|jgi:hypothetical protein